MRSIRSNLARSLGGAALATLFVGGGGLYLSLRGALEKQFDDVLIAKTEALIMASEIEDNELEIDLDVQTFAGFGTGVRGDYFIVFGEEGDVVMRSPSLGGVELTAPPQFEETPEGVSRIRLPENVSGRAYWTSYEPPVDKAETGGVVSPHLKILVAGSDAILRRTLRTTALFISIFGTIGVILTVVISKSGVRSGLKPLDRLSEEVERIDVASLARRLPAEGMPQELLAIGSKINELLARLEDSFGREKRFTSNAAHELRTPLAELRTMVELGTRWPEEFTEEHGNEMLEVIAELDALLGTLALLARAEAGVRQDREPICLRDFLSEQIDRVDSKVRERRLEILLDVNDEEGFRSDPMLFRAVLQNLLDNAVDYAPEGSLIRVEATRDRLVVENEVYDLVEEDLPQLFARFWRKSKSRSEKGHSGLGLSVVRAVAEHFGGACRAELIEGRLRVEVRWAIVPGGE
ncbi:MAG: ATP-binding protein [Verrucomicrobiales bacterium]|nr:ATP-binding protein [Verrucomicrobiales bacterium]